MTELLKIQVGDVYIQIPVDDKFSDSLDFVIDCLEFMKQHIRNIQKEEDKLEEIEK